MKRSPLHAAHQSLGARFVPFGDWEMPLQYQSVLNEHRAVRQRAGVFDVSHLGRFRLTGSGALSALSRLLCNDITRIAPGRTQYSMLLNSSGGVVDDLVIWWWRSGDFWVMPNAANHERVMGVFREAEDCEVENLRADTVLLAVQGPDAPEMIESVIGVAPGRFRTVEVSWQGAVVSMAGTGYTGERGGELCTDADTGRILLERLLETGVSPCGLGARDTLRLEAGLPLWGQDIDETTTPIEAGLDFAVDLGHEFVGREALVEQTRTGPGRRLLGFVMSGKGIPRHGYRIRSGPGTGTVTSGNISPMLGRGIGLAYVAPPLEEGEVEIEIRGTWVPGSVRRPPFHLP